jgi:alpha-L-fucosidase 2
MFWGHGSQPPFQIDANFGLTAAILEMLVYSRPGMIKILPALPDKWEQGEVEGILGRGGISVSVKWDMNEKEMKVNLISKLEQKVVIKFPVIPIQIKSNVEIRDSQLGTQYREVKLPNQEETNVDVRFYSFDKNS